MMPILWYCTFKPFLTVLMDTSSIYHKSTDPGFRLPSLKSVWDLVYPVQNPDVKEILRNLIGCLGDWGLEKT